ncbi:MAG: hypothetical protein DRJ60_00215 [Thermoprotei archaeon]|nr:MAG: hypothetical protein DRJ60_00215 [Thermoprotei archaeon]
MKFVRLKAFLQQAYQAIKLVICRRDLPENPRWRKQHYPYENCWDIDEFFEAARKAGRDSKLYTEARRIFWESYWRLLGRYRRGRPFFEVYEVADTTLRPVRDRERWVLENIVASAMAHDIVPPEAKAYTYRVYRRIYGPLVAK